MKTKTFLITLITLFLLTSLTNCESNNDDDICTFNVDDPINDLEWLKARIPTYLLLTNLFISIVSK